MNTDTPIAAGVIGVGSMGKNHARVYRELPETDLQGVSDTDAQAATEVAATYDTSSYSLHDLLDRVEVVSVATPTATHYEIVRNCIKAGVHVLVEKPFVTDPEQGRELVDLAQERDVTLQVGHIERFNPATRNLLEIVAELDIIAIDMQRLGPPVERVIEDSVVRDLMIHDADLLMALVDEPISQLNVNGTADGGYAAAHLQFPSGIVAKLTASRVTQEKERTLTITAEECHITVDLIGQTIDIHRQSLPLFAKRNGDRTYQHEGVVERVFVENREPLKSELSAFIEAVVTGTEPLVTGDDGLRVLELIDTIDELATEQPPDPAALTVE